MSISELFFSSLLNWNYSLKEAISIFAIPREQSIFHYGVKKKGLVCSPRQTSIGISVWPC